MDRRCFLEVGGTAAAVALVPSSAQSKAKLVVNDVSQLNPIEVADEKRPRATEEVAAVVRASKLPVSIGGGRFSMGGQIAAANSLHIDMRAMNRVVWFDAKRKVIRVQAGMRWRDVQEVIDPVGLSLQIMQSYSNFTVGGSVSVNCHGRYVERGPLVNAVRAVQLVTYDGNVLELTRTHEPEVFGAVFGGYGGLGVITEIELELDDNVPIERTITRVPLESYPTFFRDRIATDRSVVLHNADLMPPSFDAPVAISWSRTDKPVTVQDRLITRDSDYSMEKNAIWAITELPGGDHLRQFITSREHESAAVVWRNYEASLDAASLEPRTRYFSTYLLQEYFVPVHNFVPFARSMSHILINHNVEALNVSIRHSPADRTSLMKWAATEVFSFVLYYKQRSSDRASRRVREWTRELIDAALANGGRYYLPYRLDARLDQFARAYPEAQAFARLKSRVDPAGRFTNSLWRKYLPRV